MNSAMGLKVIIGAEHRDGQGNLISRSAVAQPPTPPICPKFKCLWKFFWRVVYHGLLNEYHKARVEYAEKHRRKEIPMKYRTGEDAPQNIHQAILGIIKLRGQNGAN